MTFAIHLVTTFSIQIFIKKNLHPSPYYLTPLISISWVRATDTRMLVNAQTQSCTCRPEPPWASQRPVRMKRRGSTEITPWYIALRTFLSSQNVWDKRQNRLVKFFPSHSINAMDFSMGRCLVLVVLSPFCARLWRGSWTHMAFITVAQGKR